MKRKYLLFVISCIVLYGGAAEGTEFNDGGTYTIDYVIQGRVSISNGTTVTLTNGGSVASIRAESDAGSFTMTGGAIENGLTLLSTSPALITGGTIGGPVALDAPLNAADFFVCGFDFAIDGEPAPYGGYDRRGQLTGTLLNGDPIDVEFWCAGGNNLVLTMPIPPRPSAPNCHFLLLAEDVNNDCRVDLLDLALVSQAWLIDCYAEPENPLCIPLDLDGDGFDAATDCDDNDPAIYPGASEVIGDSIDQDCDGEDLFYDVLFVSVPGGTFQMGDAFSEASSNELPVHTVTLSAFQMSAYKITNGQYAGFLNAAYPSQLKIVGGIVYTTSSNGLYFKTHDAVSYSQIDFVDGIFRVRSKGGRDMTHDPVNAVSWSGAMAFCDFYGYRLPTEAEWEYAARGGHSGRRFPWGNTINHDHANYAANPPLYPYDTSPYSSRTHHPSWNDGIFPYTSPVGSFTANDFGLYDMAGNTWEWVSDRYGPYPSGPQTNPTGPATGSYRICRGGNYSSDARYCRVSNRLFYNGDIVRGFRVCRDVD